MPCEFVTKIAASVSYIEGIVAVNAKAHRTDRLELKR